MNLNQYLNEGLPCGSGGGPDAPWLSENPTSGTVMAGGNSNVSIVFDATGKVTGTYQANLIIASDDPDEPQVTVPVTLIVTPVDVPDIDVTPKVAQRDAQPWANGQPHADDPQHGPGDAELPDQRCGDDTCPKRDS